MLAGKDVITGNRQEAWFKTPYQPSISANIHHVEEDVFWTNLPRCEGQVLMLQENQTVEMGISQADGFYSAETRLIKFGDKYEKFYGFAMPKFFLKTQERQFLRVPYAANVLFTSKGMVAQTALINLSAGGAMTYLVPALEEIIDSEADITMTITINNESIVLPACFSWRKSYDNIPFAGFEFHDLEPEQQEKITAIVNKYADEDRQNS